MLFRTGIKIFLMVSSKKIFLKNLKFLNFFAGPGSWNFSKITRSLYSKYEPKTHRNYPKCCSERELRLSWWFWVKNFFWKISNFWTFLQVWGSWNFSKITRSLYSKYEPKIHRNYPKCCSERELRLSWWFRVKKIFGKISNFWTFLLVWGHEIFQKSLGPYIQNASLKLTETTHNVVRNVYLDYFIGFEKNNFFGKIWNFWTFLQVQGHEIFRKSLGPYIQNASLKLTETTQNVVRNVYLDFLIGFKK